MLVGHPERSLRVNWFKRWFFKSSCHSRHFYKVDYIYQRGENLEIIYGIIISFCAQIWSKSCFISISGNGSICQTGTSVSTKTYPWSMILVSTKSLYFNHPAKWQNSGTCLIILFIAGCMIILFDVAFVKCKNQYLFFCWSN